METSRKQQMCLAFVNGIQRIHAHTDTLTGTQAAAVAEPNRSQMQRSIDTTIFESKQTNKQTNERRLSNRVHLYLPYSLNEPM